MALTPSNTQALHFKAPSFSLLDPTSNSEKTLSDLKGEYGTLVLFICNHCPYVIHIIDEIVKLANDYKDKGIKLIAINSNDVMKYPEDSPQKMIEFARKHAFSFPYLYDESQETARAYGAECTPDFFLMDQDETVIYRGRFDAARPGNQIKINGADMRTAFDSLLANEKQVENQFPSLGCNIKWK